MHSLDNAHRQAILDAADHMFVRHGYRRTTIEDIAREAGIGKGTVYLHFAKKEEIGSAWFNRWHERVLDAMRARAALVSGSPAKLRALLHERVLYRYCSLEQWGMSLMEIVDSLQPLFLVYRAQFRKREGECLEQVLAEGAASGEFRITDAGRVAESMLIATNGLLPYSVRPDEIGSRADVERQTENLIALLLRAIEP
jgi:AcrR family transcriptional regulator